MKDISQNETSSEKEESNFHTEPDNPENTTEDPLHKTIETKSPVDISSPILLPIEPVKTETMEVHHHGHVHEQKKWKEYVFQFFMLFLAVFCGFLAEYQLEQIIERHREKEYIESFINDLKLDTAQIRFRVTDITNANRGIDSLLFVAKDLTHIENLRLFCYYYISYVPRTNLLFSNEGTMQLLKNAGGLRLIRNRGAVDSIMLYDSYSRGIVGQGERYRDNVIKALDATDFIFDWRIFDGSDPKTLLTLQTISLLNPTKEQLQYFINRVSKQKGVSMIYQRYLQDQFQRASRMLPFLQKEYQL